jgi:hypothetical protein
MESDPQANAKLQPVSTWLRPLYLSAYAAFVLLLFGVLPPLAGGLPGAELLYGALGDPQLAARSSALAAPFLALGLWLAAPITVLGRALLLVLIAAAVFWLGPYITAIPAGLTLRCCWAAVLLVPLLFARNPGPKARSQTFVPLVSGIAVALSMYVLSDRLHHFGYGEAYETHTRAIVLLLLAALGAVAFALPILGANRRQAGADDDPSEAADGDDSSADTASKSSERLALHVATVGAVIAVLGAVLGLNTLFPLTSKIGLAEYLQHFGLDMSELGRLSATSLIAGRGLIGLAFGLGISIAAWPSRGHLALFVLGLGVGRWYVPKLFARITPEPIPIGSFDTALPPLLEIALGVAVLAALWMALVWIRQDRHIWKAMLRVSLGALAFLLPRTSLGTDAIPLSPWRPLETQAAYAIDSPFGLITAESHPSGQNLLVINGLTMTPPPDLANDDALALRAALDLVEANWQTGDPNPRVLLAGQLTQTRLDTFWAWKADTGREAELLWTVPWEAHLAALTDVLPGTWPLAPLPFAEAQAQIGLGHFDLVILPPALGRELSGISASQPPRATGGVVGVPYRGAGRDQPAVAWMSIAGLASAALSERIVLSGTHPEALLVGTLQGLPHLDADLFEAPGARSESPSLWSLGMHRPENRLRAQRAAFFERLAANGSPFEKALAAMMQKQAPSSPWDGALERIELDAADLSAMAAATATPPTAFQRLIWDQMASILVQKRMPGEALAVLPGLLEKTDRWPAVEFALGRTYLEMLMADEGTELLDRLFAEGHLTQRGVLTLVEYGDTLGQLERFEDALSAFEAAAAIVPGEVQIQRRIATYGVRVGREGALQQVQALIDADPDDDELRDFLGAGPYPAPEAGFDPTPLASDHDEH